MPEDPNEAPNEAQRGLRVGQLARRTGLTVRTLHHYDRIGLLRPGGRTSSGHRLYGSDEVRRLHRIVALRLFGLSLDQVARVLESDDEELAETLERQAAFIRARMEEQKALLDRIDHALGHWERQGTIDDEVLLHITKDTTMIEKHYTAEQMEQLRARAETVGQERIEAVQREWAELFQTLDQARAQGVDPESADLDAIRSKARSLIAEFTGGDAGIERSLNQAVQTDRSAMYRAWGIDEELGAYYGAVMDAGKS